MVNGGKRTPGGLMGRSPGGSKASLAGVRSPPLRGGFRARMAFRRKPWHNAKGDFLGGTRSPRPRCRAVREPRHSKIIGGKRIHGGRMGTCSGEANFAVAGVRSPPLRGGFRARMAFRREPWHNAKGDFLGGTHSVRPRCEAVPMPRHNMIIGGKGTPGGLMARSPGGSKASFTGVRSPPLQRWAIQARTALRGKPGMTQKAIFSEILCWVVKPPWFRESGLPGNETLG